MALADMAIAAMDQREAELAAIEARRVAEREAESRRSFVNEASAALTRAAAWLGDEAAQNASIDIDSRTIAIDGLTFVPDGYGNLALVASCVECGGLTNTTALIRTMWELGHTIRAWAEPDRYRVCRECEEKMYAAEQVAWDAVDAERARAALNEQMAARARDGWIVISGERDTFVNMAYADEVVVVRNADGDTERVEVWMADNDGLPVVIEDRVGILSVEMYLEWRGE